MKQFRRLLTVIIFVLSIEMVTISMILLIQIQYLFTGKTNIMEIVAETLYELISRINPDK